MLQHEQVWNPEHPSAIAFRNCPRRGLQRWSVVRGEWLDTTIHFDPSMGDKMLSYNSTWCEPEADDE